MALHPHSPSRGDRLLIRYQRTAEADAAINVVAGKHNLVFLHNPECKRDKQRRDNVQASMGACHVRVF